MAVTDKFRHASGPALDHPPTGPVRRGLVERALPARPISLGDFDLQAPGHGDGLREKLRGQLEADDPRANRCFDAAGLQPVGRLGRPVALRHR